jgi:signal peptidase II
LKRKELNNPLKKVLFTSFFLLLVDQITKIWVKSTMNLYDEIPIFDWFRILYIENNGMAFGMELPDPYGKLILTLFRIIVVGWGAFYVNKLIKQNSFPSGLLICFGLIIGGALGNIIDSTFYGDSLFHGKVVDMLSFPFSTVDLPNWLSFLEGNDGIFTFFAPVFNIADSGIFVGIVSILLFYRRHFK